jgi:hypothetical protein
MNITGKCFVDIKTELAKVPDEVPEVKLEKGNLYVKVWEGQEAFWVSVGSLKSEREAWKSMFENLVWRLGSAAGNADLTKAEVKRQLIKCGVISK